MPRKSKLEKAMDEVIQNTIASDRSLMGRKLGIQYGGERDLYDAFGYKENPVYADYRAFFDRFGIATRIVKSFADDTWGNPPVLIDGESRSDQDDNQTPFIQAWNELVKRLKVWQVMREADILAQIGHWSCMFLGAPGEYKDPAENNGLAYMMVYDEPSAQPTTWIQDSKSEKFGMPETYTIMFARPGENSFVPAAGSNPVHYSRIIHVSEDRLGLRYTGTPRLQNVINTLFDLEKITGGSAEAVWVTLVPWFILMAKEGYSLPAEGTPEARALVDKLNLLMNRMHRVAAFDNAELTKYSPDTINIRDTFDVQIEIVCITEQIPKRIFMGSEIGERAATMDLQIWNKTISTRRKFHTEPEQLDPFVKWCIEHKVLPAPQSGKWKWLWMPVFEPDPMEKSQIMANVASAANTHASGQGEKVIEANELRAIIDLPAQKQIPVTPTPEQELPKPNTVPIPEIEERRNSNGA